FWIRKERSIIKLLKNISPSYNDVVLFEAFSVALEVGEYKGLKLDAAAFTSFSRDHLDIHGNYLNYFNSKFSLFKECKKRGGTIIIHRNIPFRYQFKDLARKNNNKLTIYDGSE